jgi:hypothetical protein
VDDNATFAPPAGATEVSITVAVTLAPPMIDDLFKPRLAGDCAIDAADSAARAASAIIAHNRAGIR